MRKLLTAALLLTASTVLGQGIWKQDPVNKKIARQVTDSIQRIPRDTSVQNTTIDPATNQPDGDSGRMAFQFGKFWGHYGALGWKELGKDPDLSNYYTKTQLQTSGQASVHADNITSAPWLTTTTGDSRYPQLSGSYSNPSWITSMAWSKITGTPTTLGGYGITNAESLITPGTTAQYWRGDKNWADFASQARVSVSAGTGLAYNAGSGVFSLNAGVSDISGLTSALAGKEDVSNKSTSTSLGTSNTLYPTQNAVKTYVDAAAAGVSRSLQDVTTVGNSTDRFVRFTGVNGVVGTGPGLEVYTDGSEVAHLVSYNRTAAGYRPLKLKGSYIDAESRMLVNGPTDDGSTALQLRGVQRINSSANNDLYIGENASGFGLNIPQALPFTFGTTNAERMRISATGDVGIGGIPSSGYRFNNFGRTYLNPQSLNTFATPDFYLSTVGSASDFEINLSASTTYLGPYAPTDMSFVNSAGTDRMIIKGNGNVGIGTPTPTGHVSGRTLILAGDASTRALMELWGTDGGKSIIQSVNGDTYVGNLYGGTGNGNTRITYGAGTEGIFINGADGKVGIGTDVPASTLDVNGITTTPSLFSPSGSSLELRAAADYIVMSKGGTGTLTYVDDNGIGVGGLPGGVHTARGYFNGNVVSTDAYVLDGPTGEIGEFYLVGGSVGIRTTTNHPLTFSTNNLQRMEITAAGNTNIKNVTTTEGFGTKLVKITANYTAGISDHTIINLATSGSPQITLPSASTYPGRQIRICDYFAGGSGTEVSWTPAVKFKGSTYTSFVNPTLSAYSTVLLQSDGTDWWIVGF